MKLPKYHREEEAARNKKIVTGTGYTIWLLFSLVALTAFIPIALAVGGSFSVAKKIGERLK